MACIAGRLVWEPRGRGSVGISAGVRRFEDITPAAATVGYLRCGYRAEVSMVAVFILASWMAFPSIYFFIVSSLSTSTSANVFASSLPTCAWIYHYFLFLSLNSVFLNYLGRPGQHGRYPLAEIASAADLALGDEASIFHPITMSSSHTCLTSLLDLTTPLCRRRTSFFMENLLHGFWSDASVEHATPSDYASTTSTQRFRQFFENVSNPTEKTAGVVKIHVSAQTRLWRRAQQCDNLLEQSVGESRSSLRTLPRGDMDLGSRRGAMLWMCSCATGLGYRCVTRVKIALYIDPHLRPVLTSPEEG